MKTHAPVRSLMGRFHENYGSKRSSALLIVLGCLVLISVLIVAFFYAVTAERQSAQFYANTSSVKLLADSTISLVEGQIKDATRGINTSGNTLSWASQPGMIRDYNTTGLPDSYYKLYSATNMVGSGAYDPTKNDIPPVAWASSPAVYSDLNDPVSVSGVNTYPIVDPQATNSVKGFSVSSAVPATTTSHDTLPMPVRWLYVLQQGQVIAPDPGSTGNKATFTQSAIQPGPTNAIAGRIAFWTDDDTCKVNINTAAGDAWVDANSTTQPAYLATGNPGSYWATPHIAFETNMAYYQPAQGEYQRYAGHPATTYLSTVFPSLTAAQIYSIVPRVGLGGSLSGTTAASASIIPTLDSDRLYSSVDELVVSPGRTLNSNPPLTKTSVEQARFFLTAASRAPEVNLYNQPRIVTWPINSNLTAATGTAYGTPYDQLLAYCGTLNGNAYYFQRSNSKSPTVDLPTTATTTGLGRNRSLITYLRNLTSLPVPGFSTTGETFSSKYGLDRDQIITEIFDYIRCLDLQDLGVTNQYAAGTAQVAPIDDTASDGATPLRGFGRMPVITEADLLFITRAETSADGSKVSYSSAIDGAAPAAGFARVQAALMLKTFDPCVGYSVYTPNFKVVVTGLKAMTWSTGTSGVKSVGFNDPASVTINQYTAGSNSFNKAQQGVYPCVSGNGYSTPATGLVALGSLDCPTGGTFNITDAPFTIKVYDSTGTTLLQTFSNMDFPPSSAGFPVPLLAPMVTSTTGSVTDYRLLTTAGRFNLANLGADGMFQTIFCSRDVVRGIILTTDPRSAAGSQTVAGSNFVKALGYDTSTLSLAHGITAQSNGNAHPFPGALFGNLVPNVEYSAGSSGTLTSPFVVAIGSVPDFNYAVPTGTATPAAGPGVQPQACGTGSIKWDGSVFTGSITGASGLPKAQVSYNPEVFTQSGGYAVGAPGVFIAGSTTLNGDWDTGVGFDKDGCYINKADEGAVAYNHGATPTPFLPYFGAGYQTSSAGISGDTLTMAAGTFFSPDRQIPSAGMFGSLPTGIIRNKPYQTLLFRPDPDGTKTHDGAKSPQDHLWMDLFNMPVVEPYAISDPFSTAGKVNMNYQIVPFTYITRSTALQAALRSEQILAIPATKGTSYKGFWGLCTNMSYFLDLSQTLTGFTNMFTTGTTDGTGSTPDIFRSATQICNVWLVPATMGLSYSSMQSFWQSATATGGALTGDNLRERPYANIYARLTTKSNTYTVHMRVQTLKAVKTADPTFSTWVEGSDVVTGEYRGSATLERYLDTSDTTIPDYATVAQPLTAGQAIDNFYKFRVVETKQFTP